MKLFRPTQSLALIIVASLALQGPLAAMSYVRKGADELSIRMVAVYENAKKMQQNIAALSKNVSCLDQGTCSQQVLDSINSSMAGVSSSLTTVSKALGAGYSPEKAAELRSKLGIFVGAAYDKLAQGAAKAQEKFDGIKAFGTRLATGTMNPAEKAQFVFALKVLAAIVAAVIAVVSTVLVTKGVMDRKGNLSPALPPRPDDWEKNPEDAKRRFLEIGGDASEAERLYRNYTRDQGGRTTSISGIPAQRVPVLPQEEVAPALPPRPDDWKNNPEDAKRRFLEIYGEKAASEAQRLYDQATQPSRGGLLDEIKAGKKLKPVSQTPATPKEPTIADLLKKRRADIGEDQDFGDSYEDEGDIQVAKRQKTNADALQDTQNKITQAKAEMAAQKERLELRKKQFEAAESGSKAKAQLRQDIKNLERAIDRSDTTLLFLDEVLARSGKSGLSIESVKIPTINKPLPGADIQGASDEEWGY